MGISVRQTYKLVDRIVKKLEEDFVGRSLDGDAIFRLAARLEDLLKRNVDRQAIYQSLLPLLGVAFTDDTFLLTVRRLVGNISRLANMRPVLPWDGQPSAEWCLAEILSLKLVSMRRRGEVGYQVCFRIHAGLSAGLLSHRIWSRPALGILATELGFSIGCRGKVLFEDPKQVVGMVGEVLVAPVPDKKGRPSVTKARSSPAQRAMNRKLFFLRERKNDKDAVYPCPHRVKLPCHKCPVGYSPGEGAEPSCDLATHPWTFRLDQCSSCGQQRFFDPGESLLDCTHCYRRKAYTGEAGFV